MNNWLHKWLEGLGTAYPGASSSYWRAMPLGRLKKLLAAAFFTVSVIGFVLDLLLLKSQAGDSQQEQMDGRVETSPFYSSGQGACCHRAH